MQICLTFRPTVSPLCQNCEFFGQMFFLEKESDAWIDYVHQHHARCGSFSPIFFVVIAPFFLDCYVSSETSETSLVSNRQLKTFQRKRELKRTKRNQRKNEKETKRRLMMAANVKRKRYLKRRKNRGQRIKKSPRRKMRPVNFFKSFLEKLKMKERSLRSFFCPVS